MKWTFKGIKNSKGSDWRNLCIKCQYQFQDGRSEKRAGIVCVSVFRSNRDNMLLSAYRFLILYGQGLLSIEFSWEPDDCFDVKSIEQVTARKYVCVRKRVG